MPIDTSPPSSPVRKKPRLSSPGDIDRSCTNLTPTQPFLGFTKATALPSNVKDDPDNPFTSQHPPSGKSSSIPPGLGFTSASSIGHDPERSPSPLPPSEQDYDIWLQPSTTLPAVSFQHPSFASSSAMLRPTGFVRPGTKSIIAPSAAALAKARERFKSWEGDLEDTENVNPSNVVGPLPHSPFQRPALRVMDNSLPTPESPSPSAFSRPINSNKFPTVDQPSMKQKSFRSPLIKSTPVKNHLASPLNPRVNFASVANMTQRPKSPLTPSTPLPTTKTMASIQTPGRPPVRSSRTTPAPFVTPFKPGMRPGEPGWMKLQESARKEKAGSPSSILSASTPEIRTISRAKHHKTFFNLSHPPNRKTLSSSGLRPQQYTKEDFESMQINIHELKQITPTLATYYSFHTTSAILPSLVDEIPQVLGPAAALEELLNLGCSLATKPWVDNHWALILWKLAGMVALDPESENDSSTRRWCWREVKRQLLYRYERELNQAKRPALRLISTQDAPAALPMNLCISNIFSPEDGTGSTFPELEITDGWYRLKARIDAPMARAVERGSIRIGRKIGVAGARLNSERKEPQDILDAYNSVKLVLSGNSSHLLSWDAKLGFTKGPSISTMHSLTPDGGPIASMDVVVVKTHPLAFIEFCTDATGKKWREGPRGEAEEMKVNEQWEKKRQEGASKIQANFDKKIARYESYIDKLERRAGSVLSRHTSDEPPDHIEELYDQLEEHDDALGLLSRISSQDAAWLAQHTKRCMQVEREQVGEEIEKELQTACPPRDVRSFRVIAVEDSQTYRRPANRYVQLTVWDILSLTLSEGVKPGAIEIGSRFMITNLMPQQQGSWMGNKPNSQIFLATTRSTRWHKLKSS
ncbi:hypothetical protein AGABI1DRAFT_104048 [Agaricus bisporus var. burnettii JB137-S8]|uniref:BRCA2 OB1 domain-containing protein n=1 Tax=Agaricus bisporus var. burnettii (strain JB137-S8 / ATCC MYA-4627 / FGSC 10392) TaxID=597362 RepID=K5Y757_AGABU|nr:uncharacterized protein AGABI1DRAFT_104048 [Agaricus bisporus var. burnettii JB137-S8]EKM84055.1 hypothetical protein AGABI1DRAFT_104048 [Agaricus bisporus var. burnettii JB137-S8]